MAKIIVAEDDDLQRYLIVSALIERQHEVREAKDGVQALVLFLGTSPDLVITDIEMPNQNGHWLISEIRKFDPLLPIVAMSAGSPNQLSRAKALGADVCMSKPLRRVEFLGTIDDLVSTAELEG